MTGKDGPLFFVAYGFEASVIHHVRQMYGVTGDVSRFNSSAIVELFVSKVRVNCSHPFLCWCINLMPKNSGCPSAEAVHGIVQYCAF